MPGGLHLPHKKKKKKTVEFTVKTSKETHMAFKHLSEAQVAVGKAIEHMKPLDRRAASRLSNRLGALMVKVLSRKG